MYTFVNFLLVKKFIRPFCQLIHIVLFSPYKFLPLQR